MAGKSFIQLDTDLIKSLYLDDKKTVREIAEIVGTSPKTVNRRLVASGVEMRPPGPEHHTMLKDRDWLHEQYVTMNKTAEQIAQEIGASATVVSSWVRRHNIPSKPTGNAKGKKFGDEFRKKLSIAQKGRRTGSDNPNWKGGLIHPDHRLRSSRQSVEWSKAVRARDGHKCVECGATGRLHAHHVNSWKHYPELRHDVSNGVTLCPPCHQKAHGWRFPAWAYHGENRTSAEQA